MCYSFHSLHDQLSFLVLVIFSIHSRVMRVQFFRVALSENCQLILIYCSVRPLLKARTSRSRLSCGGGRRCKHSRASAENSISNRFNQLADFGVL